MKRVLKNINIYNVLFSFLFSLTLLMDIKIILPESKIDVFSQLRFASFQVSDLFRFLLFFVINYLIIHFIEKIYRKIISIKPKESPKNKHIFLTSFLLLLLFWLPYILSYFPGGVFSDTFNSIYQLASFDEYGFTLLTNHHPILYTFMLKLFTVLGSHLTNLGLTGGLIFFGIFQYIGCALAVSYFIHVIHKKNIPIQYTYLALAFFCLFPLVPFYVISLWKDTPFSFVLFIFITFILDMITSPSTFLEDKKNIILYCIISFFVCFLRNNGIFIVLGTSLILLLLNLKELRTKKKVFCFSSIITIIVVAMIEGPVYSHFDLNGEAFVESFAIPFQQIAYSIKNDADLSIEEQEFVNTIIPIEDLKEAYTPLNFDSIKWHTNFNNYAFSSNKLEFIKLWFKLLPKNLKNYTQSYLLQTLGYWDILKSSDEAYIQYEIWPGFEPIEQKDLFYELTHISFRNIVEPTKYISAALFFWVMIISMIITLTNKKYKYLVIYLPALLLWLSIMIATPIAFSLRYVYILVLMIPLDIIIPILPYKKD